MFYSIHIWDSGTTYVIYRIFMILYVSNIMDENERPMQRHPMAISKQKTIKGLGGADVPQANLC